MTLPLVLTLNFRQFETGIFVRFDVATFVGLKRNFRRLGTEFMSVLRVTLPLVLNWNFRRLWRWCRCNVNWRSIVARRQWRSGSFCRCDRSRLLSSWRLSVARRQWRFGSFSHSIPLSVSCNTVNTGARRRWRSGNYSPFTCCSREACKLPVAVSLSRDTCFAVVDDGFVLVGPWNFGKFQLGEFVSFPTLVFCAYQPMNSWTVRDVYESMWRPVT